MKRIYVVTVNQEFAPVEHILVKAVTAAQAIRHVADPLFKAKVASQDDLVQLAKTHTVVEAE